MEGQRSFVPVITAHLLNLQIQTWNLNQNCMTFEETHRKQFTRFLAQGWQARLEWPLRPYHGVKQSEVILELWSNWNLWKSILEHRVDEDFCSLDQAMDDATRQAVRLRQHPVSSDRKTNAANLFESNRWQQELTVASPSWCSKHRCRQTELRLVSLHITIYTIDIYRYLDSIRFRSWRFVFWCVSSVTELELRSIEELREHLDRIDLLPCWASSTGES